MGNGHSQRNGSMDDEESMPLVQSRRRPSHGAIERSHRRPAGQHRRTRHGSSDQRTMYREILGFFFVASAAFSFSVMALLVRMGAILEEMHFPSFQLVLSRSVFQFAAATAVLLSLGLNPLGPKEMRFWLLMRGVVGGVGMILLFFALTKLSLGECTVLVFTMPIFTIVFSRIFLGEPLDVIDEAFGLLCLCGIALIAKPHMLFNPELSKAAKDRFTGTCAALAAALAQASIFIIIKSMGGRVHYMMNVQYLGLVCALIAPIGAVVFKEPRWHLPSSMEECIVFLGVGFFGLLAQIFISRGLQLCRAGPGAILTNLQILFSFVLGIVFLNEIPSSTSVIGGLIILTSTLGVACNKIFRR
eukprot:Plantae.Rhodophyta-Purpureofilum_apyrenoidigerum.ctg5016.p1 GENE.Plantae.Rhodophyta-Purpureofilum_apyrenoidigerum.ctg5016~~Plantae.Rhodophyta-Purpureofilum_apyrenoidigerum.ctg5016.p1  ORF type:complete len:359 (-),score=41.05 Plantae.Rhodophyta-Purpureofilum_apyrenoidigerum.ctg5016:150-1226(-)